MFIVCLVWLFIANGLVLQKPQKDLVDLAVGLVAVRSWVNLKDLEGILKLRCQWYTLLQNPFAQGWTKKWVSNHSWFFLILPNTCLVIQAPNFSVCDFCPLTVKILGQVMGIIFSVVFPSKLNVIVNLIRSYPWGFGCRRCRSLLMSLSARLMISNLFVIVSHACSSLHYLWLMDNSDSGLPNKQSAYNHHCQTTDWLLTTRMWIWRPKPLDCLCRW